MALIQGEGPTKSKINSNLYICQPYINPVDVVPADEHQSILSALSHVSFVHSKGKRVLTDFSCEFFVLSIFPANVLLYQWQLVIPMRSSRFLHL